MITELDKTSKIVIYFAPLLILVASWVWQHALEKHYRWESSPIITAVVSVTAFFITNSFICLWIVGVTGPIIFCLISIVVLAMIFIPLTFMEEHDIAFYLVLILIILVYVYQSYLVWNNL